MTLSREGVFSPDLLTFFVATFYQVNFSADLLKS